MKGVYIFIVKQKDSNRQYSRTKVLAELRKNSANKDVLSMSAEYKDANGHVVRGQCLDYALQFSPMLKTSKEFMFLYRMWEQNHLNDMHAGTKAQEDALKLAKKQGIIIKNADFSICCEYLKSINMYEVKYRGKPYKYGSNWLYRSIPKKDKEKYIKIIRKVKVIVIV